MTVAELDRIAKQFGSNRVTQSLAYLGFNPGKLGNSTYSVNVTKNNKGNIQGGYVFGNQLETGFQRGDIVQIVNRTTYTYRKNGARSAPIPSGVVESFEISNGLTRSPDIHDFVYYLDLDLDPDIYRASHHTTIYSSVSRLLQGDQPYVNGYAQQFEGKGPLPSFNVLSSGIMNGSASGAAPVPILGYLSLQNAVLQPKGMLRQASERAGLNRGPTTVYRIDFTFDREGNWSLICMELEIFYFGKTYFDSFLGLILQGPPPQGPPKISPKPR